MPNGWVLAREDGEPMRPDMAGERTARLVPFCPMHSQPPTVEDTKVWHELVEACVALRPLRVLPAHQRLGDRDVARRWDRWYAAVNAAWDKLTD